MKPIFVLSSVKYLMMSIACLLLMCCRYNFRLQLFQSRENFKCHAVRLKKRWKNRKRLWYSDSRWGKGKISAWVSRKRLRLWRWPPQYRLFRCFSTYLMSYIFQWTAHSNFDLYISYITYFLYSIHSISLYFIFYFICISYHV